VFLISDFFCQEQQKMSAEKEAELKALFNSYDDNGDNCISPGELKSAFKKLGQEITDDEIDEMVRSNDRMCFSI